MKEYKDIGELYKDKFENFSPEPSPKVWEHIQMKMAKPSIAYKKFIYGAATFVGAMRLIVASLYITSNKENDNDINTAKQTTEATHQTETTKKSTQITQTEHDNQVVNQVNTVKYTDVQLSETPSFSESQASEQPTVAKQEKEEYVPHVSQIVSDKAPWNESKEKQIVSSSEIKTTPPPKTNESKLKVFVSKDTTVCENSTITLSIRNAEHIRWSSGETSQDVKVQITNSQNFHVSYKDKNGKDTMANIFVRCVPCTELTIPTAFTPNGDGLNDEFKVYASGVVHSYEIIIFNRFNKEMFRSSNINQGWDGNAMGVAQPHGLYLYVIRYMDNFNQCVERKGEFLLLRN